MSADKKKPPVGDVPAARAAQPALNDQIAINRTVTAADPAAIPRIDPRFRITPRDVRSKQLRVVAGDMESETLDVLREAVAAGAGLQSHMGEFAPSASEGEEILERIVSTQALLAVALPLVACHQELEDIALSDAVIFIEKLHAEYQHYVERRPELAQRYPKLARFFEQRSARISEGRARAKADSSPERPIPLVAANGK